MDYFMDDFHFYRDLPLTKNGGDPVPTGYMRSVKVEIRGNP